MPRSKPSRPLRPEEIRSELRDLNAKAEGREFTDDERDRWNDLNGQIEEVDRRLLRLQELAERGGNTESEETSVAAYNRGRQSSGGTSLPAELSSVRSKALRTIEAHSGELSARAADRLEAIVDEDVRGPERGATARYLTAAGAPSYNSAFGKVLADPMSAPLRFTDDERQAWSHAVEVMDEQRSLGLGTQGGGYPVPVVLDPSLNLISDSSVNPIRQLARVETLVGNVWEGVNTLGTTATYAAEFTEVGDGSPTLTQPTMNVEKAHVFVPFSIEVGQDWVTLGQEMARVLADSKDQLEASKFLTGLGHGSNQPQGLIAAGGATAVVTTATTATFAVADLYSLEQSLPERWQPRASIVANRATYNKIRQFDTAGGANMWVQLQDQYPPGLLGYPSYNWSNYANTTTTSGSTILTLGDFSQYVIAERVGMQVELVQHLFGASNRYPIGARGFYAFWRNTGGPLTANAFKSLKVL